MWSTLMLFIKPNKVHNHGDLGGILGNGKKVPIAPPPNIQGFNTPVAYQSSGEDQPLWGNFKHRTEVACNQV